MVPFLLWFILYFEAISKYKSPGAYIRRGYLTENFFRFEFGGLNMERFIFGILQCKRSIPTHHKTRRLDRLRGMFWSMKAF